MTLEETVALLSPLALALRVDLDAPTFRAYHAQLKAVPAALVDQALTDLSDGGLVFMPTAPQIKQAAEKKRRQLLAANPYTGCVECENQIGYRPVMGENSQQITVERCPCKTRHLARLESLGLREQLSDLPGEAGVGENERTYPAFEELPPKVQAQIRDITGRRQIR
jgi:hypothetical protein